MRSHITGNDDNLCGALAHALLYLDRAEEKAGFEDDDREDVTLMRQAAERILARSKRSYRRSASGGFVLSPTK